MINGYKLRGGGLLSKPVIRQLTVEDAAELQAISVETFKDTFAAQNTTANMTAFLTSAYNLPKLTTNYNDLVHDSILLKLAVKC